VVSRYRRDAKRRREIAEALVLRGTSASEIPDEDTSDRVALYRKMGRLKPIDREILTLRYFDDMESPQIAEVLGLTAGAVRVRISRTVRRLRNELGETRNNG
jgi:RNA polymerase sigma-70 factor, ECF subfamily